MRARQRIRGRSNPRNFKLTSTCAFCAQTAATAAAGRTSGAGRGRSAKIPGGRFVPFFFYSLRPVAASQAGRVFATPALGCLQHSFVDSLFCCLWPPAAHSSGAALRRTMRYDVLQALQLPPVPCPLACTTWWQPGRPQAEGSGACCFLRERGGRRGGPRLRQEMTRAAA
jgi:hypothetical protein